MLALINVAVIVTMQYVGQALKPGGIIPFEFAWTAANAQQMISDWQRLGVIPQVYFLIGFDYLFMLTYSSFLAVACLQAAYSSSGAGQVFFRILAGLQPVAALLDAIENFALYQVVGGNTDEIWPRLSFVCAVPKFLIALTALLAWLGTTVYLKVRR